MYDMIGRVLDPEQKQDGQDGEDDQRLGHNVVLVLVLVVNLKNVRVS